MSRYWSMSPECGMSALRCGGWSVAAGSWFTAVFEMPHMPTLPLDQGCVPAHSMAS